MKKADYIYGCIGSPLFFYLLGAFLFFGGWIIFIYTMIWSKNYYALFIAPMQQKSATSSPTLEIISSTFPLRLQHASAGVIISLVYAILPFQPKYGDVDKDLYEWRLTARYVLIIAMLAIGAGIGCVPLFLQSALPLRHDELDAAITSAASNGPMGIFYQCMTLILGVMVILGGQRLTPNAGMVALSVDVFGI